MLRGVDEPQPDIAMAAQFADLLDRGRQRCGEVYVVRGSLRSVMNAKASSAELADVTITGAGGLEALGGALLAAELVGDAKADLVIGAPDAVGPKLEQREGRVYVVPGERLVGR